MSIKWFLGILLSLALFSVSPSPAFAVIQSLNGLTPQNQFLQSTISNITITPSGNTHTFAWNGFLPVSMGGTGAGSFASGSILFSNGTTFAQDNLNLFWDNTNKYLGLGTSSPGYRLDVSGSARATNLISIGDATINSLNVGLGGGSVDSNTSVGAFALANSNSSSYQNTAVGNRALSGAGSSGGSTAVGFWSLINNTGDGNTAVGLRAMAENTTGVSNVAFGRSALDGGNIGSFNVALGPEVLSNNHEGNYNIGIGYRAGSNYPTGLLISPENSIYIGYNTKGYDNNDSNSIVIGTDAVGAGADTAVLGNSNLGNVFFGSAEGRANIYAAQLFLNSPLRPGCIALGDSDGSGITYITANDGVLTASSTKPSICQ